MTWWICPWYFAMFFFGWCGDSIGHMGIWTYRWDSLIESSGISTSTRVARFAPPLDPGLECTLYTKHVKVGTGLGCLHLVILVRQGPQTRTSRRKESNWKNRGAGTGLSGCGKHGGNHQKCESVFFYRLMGLMGIDSQKQQAMCPKIGYTTIYWPSVSGKWC